ncbi:hypothetical protein G9A89_011668 [Geosiphon pyriformis]|nr:hypothetical protein G9A89_011668 [Geosiphon pyriformis]
MFIVSLHLNTAFASAFVDDNVPSIAIPNLVSILCVIKAAALLASSEPALTSEPSVDISISFLSLNFSHTHFYCVCAKTFFLSLTATTQFTTSQIWKMTDNNINSEVTTVTQRSTSVETIVSEYQVEGKITSTVEGEDINANPQSSLTVETARLITPSFRFETTNRPFGSVNTSSGDNTLFRIAKTSKRTAPHRRAADFSPITANKLEEKANKKYRHIGELSIKGLSEKFTQISEENLPETTSVQTDTFVLQPMFNKGGNSNKFQMEAWTGEKKASKSLRKMDGTSKVPKEDRNRAAQIEAALRKCNPDILDRINKGKSALENEKQTDNPFDANRDKPNAEDVAEDIEESESSLSSRMASPSPG